MDVLIHVFSNVFLVGILMLLFDYAITRGKNYLEMEVNKLRKKTNWNLECRPLRFLLCIKN